MLCFYYYYLNLDLKRFKDCASQAKLNNSSNNSFDFENLSIGKKGTSLTTTYKPLKNTRPL